MVALALAILVAVMGVISDSVPYSASEYSTYRRLFWGVAGFFNDIVTWFVIVMMVTTLLAKTVWLRMASGAAWSVLSILMYLALGGDGGWYSGAWLDWMLPAMVGGTVAGFAGWFAARHSWTWWVILALVLGRLLMNGASVWSALVGQVHSTLLVALGLCCAALAVIGRSRPKELRASPKAVVR